MFKYVPRLERCETVRAKQGTKLIHGGIRKVIRYEGFWVGRVHNLAVGSLDVKVIEVLVHFAEIRLSE